VCRYVYASVGAGVGGGRVREGYWRTFMSVYIILHTSFH